MADIDKPSQSACELNCVSPGCTWASRNANQGYVLNTVDEVWLRTYLSRGTEPAHLGFIFLYGIILCVS